ncbi:LOW QUALITY PROTEIN: hypothetical protein KUTeg_006657 [Tegillarca granosa]|uniref:C17orf113 probable zinc finger domain-containing protein n=1 Tax=Tegillarca granosa TaxID=220873 RepID=A0ABQ9FDE8_TEGGR|nr:LOW QUALITY PROTEIN: hypothetical protein KUTeg_006657 [Tegillarca granosa]
MYPSEEYVLQMSVWSYWFWVGTLTIFTMGKRKLPFSDNNTNKVAKLSAFGFKTPGLNLVSNENSPANVDIPVKTTSSASSRKFLETWKFGRPWLRYDSEQKLMFCDICIRACVKNSFTVGCDVMKKECVVKHAKGTDDNSHGAANKTAVLAALCNVHFAAKFNLANTIVPELNKLCISQGVSELMQLKVDQHTTYEHHSSIREFQQSLAEVLEDDLVVRIKVIMIDESTDVSVHQNLVVYVRILEKVLGRVQANTYFLGIRELCSATADSIRAETLPKIWLGERQFSLLLKVFHTRWLSFEGAVQSVVDNFEGVVSVFLEEGSARALSLHKPITCFKFLYTAHFLADVLKQLSILCRAYQSSDIDFVEVNPLLQSTVEVLRRLRDSKSGDNLVQFCKMAPPEPVVDEMGTCSFQFRGHTIRDSASQRSEAVSACEIFVSNVIDNLKDRFTEKGDASILCALNKFFSPSCLVEAVEEDVVSEVVSYLCNCMAGSKSECRQEILGFVSFAKTKIESNCKVYSTSKEVVHEKGGCVVFNVTSAVF